MFSKVTIFEKCSILIICQFGHFSFSKLFLSARSVYVICNFHYNPSYPSKFSFHTTLMSTPILFQIHFGFFLTLVSVQLDLVQFWFVSVLIPHNFCFCSNMVSTQLWFLPIFVFQITQPTQLQFPLYFGHPPTIISLYST